MELLGFEFEVFDFLVSGLLVPIFFYFKAKKIKIKANISRPFSYGRLEDFPVRVDLVNYGQRQAFVNRLILEVTAWNSWARVIDLKRHGIDKLIIVDGEHFTKTIYLKEEVESLKSSYSSSVGFLDKIFPLKVKFSLLTTTNESIKVKTGEEAKSKIIEFIKD